MSDASFLVQNLTLMALLIISTAMSSIITHKGWNRYFPESGASMVFGILVGLAFQFMSLLNLKQEFEFEPELFYFVLLPPIIFDAGYSMKKRLFFLNMGTILLHAVFGTLIAAVVFGYGVYFFASVGAIHTIDGNHALESLLFGALMSATDTVSILSVMGSPGLEVDSTLYALIFGESVLNDAVAIVLFRTLSNFTGGAFSFLDLIKAILMFSFVSGGSVLIGTGVGLIASIFFKKFARTLQQAPHLEVAGLMMFAYLSYLVAEIAQTSGVMSLFLTGVTLKHYAWYSLSPHGQTSSEQVFRVFSFVSETFVFVYLGINIGQSVWSSFFVWDPLLVFICIMLCFLSRAVGVFGLYIFANLKRKKRVPANFQVMQWFAGLRGAVAFSLALIADTKNKNAIITTTLMIVLFTIICEGSLTAPLIRFLNVKKKLSPQGFPLHESQDDYVPPPEEMSDTVSLTNSPGSDQDPSNMSLFHRYWRKVDDGFIKPYVGGKPRPGYETH